MGIIEKTADTSAGDDGDDYTYGITSTLKGGLTSTFKGGLTSTIQGGDEAVKLDMGLKDVNIDVGLDDVNLDMGLKDVNIDSDISSTLDVEPMQLDLCIDVGLSKLPNACISQPYESHFGVIVLGAELIGFTWSGESNTIIDDLPNRPHVEPGGQPTQRHATAARRTFERRVAVNRGPDSGLHIRLN